MSFLRASGRLLPAIRRFAKKSCAEESGPCQKKMERIFCDEPCDSGGGKGGKDGQIAPGYFKLKETQKKFQVDDGLPIHLKAGSKDKALYNLNMLLIWLGVVYCVYVWGDLAYPKAKRGKKADAD